MTVAYRHRVLVRSPLGAAVRQRSAGSVCRGLPFPGGTRDATAATELLLAPFLHRSSPSLSQGLRLALADLGGVAGVGAVCDRFAESQGRRVARRDARVILGRSPTVRLGAGYHCFEWSDLEPVVELVRRWVEHDAVEVDDVVERVLATYANGDQRAVRSWLGQQPDGLRVVDDLVSLERS